MSARFPRKTRLTEVNDFKRVFANAKRITAPHLLLLYVESERKAPRLGLAISKKHVKLATHRNRIKRLVREQFRQHLLIGGVDIVVVSRYSLALASSDDIKKTLERLWWKLKKQCVILQ